MATYYEFRRSPEGQNDWTIIATNQPEPEYTDSGLPELTSFDYQVRACDGGVCSDWSDSVTITTGAEPVVDVDFSVIWNIHQFVHDNFEVIWNVEEFVDFDLTTSWNVQQLVDNDLTVFWNVLIHVERDYELLWNVQQISIVDVDYEILWNIDSDFVQSDFDLDVLWNVNALVDLDIGVFWHVQEQVDFDLGISWNVYELVDSDLDLLWEVESTSAFDLTILWNVEESQPGIDLETLWNVNSITDKDLNILWDVDQAKPSANHDLLLRWHIQSIVPIQPVAPPTWREIREGDTFFLHSPSNGVTGLSGKVRVVKRVYTGDDPLPELEMEYIEPIQRTTPRIAAQNTPASRPESADQDLVRQSKQSAKKVWQLEQG